MAKHDVPRCQGRRHLPDDIEKRVVVRHENLDIITHLGQLGRRAQEIRNRTRISVPDEHVKTLTTQIFCDPASNDTEPHYTDIFLGSMSHLNWMRPLATVGRLFSLRLKLASRK